MNTMANQQRRSRWAANAQQGFTLVEAMVAMGVLSVGLLGLAGLSGMSLAKNVDASDLTRATNLASDMMERIQNNRQYVIDYNGINAASACAQSATTQRMALGDCTQWQTLLTNSGLAGAGGDVVVTRLDPDPTMNSVTMNRFLVSVTISWKTKSSGGGLQRNPSVVLRGVVAPE